MLSRRAMLGLGLALVAMPAARVLAAILPHAKTQRGADQGVARRVAGKVVAR